MARYNGFSVPQLALARLLRDKGKEVSKKDLEDYVSEYTGRKTHAEKLAWELRTKYHQNIHTVHKGRGEDGKSKKFYILNEGTPIAQKPVRSRNGPELKPEAIEAAKILERERKVA
mgnify:CR=1 FL=1